MNKKIAIGAIILIIILAIGAGVWKWGKEETDRKMKIDIQNTNDISGEVNDGKFVSKIINISFNYNDYDKFEEKLKKTDKEGILVHFINNNKMGTSFDIISKDYEKQDLEFRDIYTFDLNDKYKQVHNIFSQRDNEIVIKHSDNIFQLIGYNNIECTADVSTQLFYIFPNTSKFKYAVFYLGNHYEIDLKRVLPSYNEGEENKDCRGFKTSEIKEIFKFISSGKVELINNRLKDSLKITNSFVY